MTDSNWITVCKLDDLVENSGVCALVNGQQVALFQLGKSDDNKVYAISNWDPIGKANVLYRGLLASHDDKIVVASPLYKQRFCLESGACLDDPEQQVSVYQTRVVDDTIQLGFAS